MKRLNQTVLAPGRISARQFGFTPGKSTEDADLCTSADARRLQGIQRRALLAVTKVYRTASWESLCVITGEIPIDLLLEKHRGLFNLRRGKDVRIADTVSKLTSRR